MGNSESSLPEGNSRNDQYIEEQKKIIMAQQEQINSLRQQQEEILNQQQEEILTQPPPLQESIKQQQESILKQNNPQNPQQNHPNMFNSNNVNQVLPDKHNKFDKALSIFQIPRSYDTITLKKKYIQLALNHHPDRGGDKEIFKKIQLAYKILLKHLEESKHNHDHNQLRNNFKEFQGTQSNEPVMDIKSEHSFNRELFNKSYEEHREANIFDKGYSDWIKESSKNDAPQIPETLKDGKFNENIFHSEFNKHKKIINKNNNSIIKYDQPKIDISFKGKDTLVTLGQDKISDFSGESAGGLAYRDLKDAYTNTLLIDVEDIDITARPYNLNDKTLERKDISYELNDKDQIIEAKRILDEEIEEKKRLERIRILDEQSSETYEKIHRRMLG